MPGFVKMATLDELPPGGSKEVEHDGRIYALFNVDGAITALDGICPHQGGPLAEGALEGTIVTCACHGSQFDVTTGAVRRGPAREPVRAFQVRIKGDSVQVEA